MTVMLLMMMIEMEDEDDDNESDDNSHNSDDNGAGWPSEPCQCFHLGLDGERQTEGTDASRKRDTRSSAGHHKSEDTSDSREDETAVSLFFMTFLPHHSVLNIYMTLQPKHTCPAHPYPSD